MVYPEAAILVHPESPASVVELADAVGSTSQLIKQQKSSPHPQMIVAINKGIFFKMQQLVPDKELIEAPTAGAGATCRSCAHCPWMANERSLKRLKTHLSMVVSNTKFSFLTNYVLSPYPIEPHARVC